MYINKYIIKKKDLEYIYIPPDVVEIAFDTADIIASEADADTSETAEAKLLSTLAKEVAKESTESVVLASETVGAALALSALSEAAAGVGVGVASAAVVAAPVAASVAGPVK